jgi:hypothetical protein
LLHVFERHTLSLDAAALADLALNGARPRRVLDLSLPRPTRRRLRFSGALACVTRASELDRPICRRDQHEQMLAHASARAIAVPLMGLVGGSIASSLAGVLGSDARKSAVSA